MTTPPITIDLEYRGIPEAAAAFLFRTEAGPVLIESQHPYANHVLRFAKAWSELPHLRMSSCLPTCDGSLVAFNWFTSVFVTKKTGFWVELS